MQPRALEFKKMAALLKKKQEACSIKKALDCIPSTTWPCRRSKLFRRSCGSFGCIGSSIDQRSCQSGRAYSTPKLSTAAVDRPNSSKAWSSISMTRKVFFMLMLRLAAEILGPRMQRDVGNILDNYRMRRKLRIDAMMVLEHALDLISGHPCFPHDHRDAPRIDVPSCETCKLNWMEL